MKTARLIRGSSGIYGTFGRIYSGDFSCFTLEPPWKGNLRNLSCIPDGVYKCVWHRSPRFGWVYHITGVPDRSLVLIHPGNLGGDTEKGLRTHTHGCVLLGKNTGWLGKQKAILASSFACQDFFEYLNKD